MSSSVLYIHDEIVHNKLAAQIILPIVFQTSNPGSVLDVGCGIGTWLSVCEELGIKDYIGIDGDYVDREKLRIPITNFKSLDLRDSFDLNRRFDLVVCLEVAEHLPESSANTLIESIVKHGNTILFSAAIPGQSGQNHINEQWPAYWQDKFEKHGFYFHDTLRPLIWNNEKVEWWYRQNIFMVTKEKPATPPSVIIHPELFKIAHSNFEKMLVSLEEGKQGLRISTRIFFNAVLFKIRNWLRL